MSGIPTVGGKGLAPAADSEGPAESLQALTRARVANILRS
jgi:hypothetical protein